MSRSPASKQSYDELKQELETILMQLQAPDLDIDEAANVYKRGMEIVSLLEKRLQSLEASIRAIKTDFKVPED